MKIYCENNFYEMKFIRCIFALSDNIIYFLRLEDGD